MKALAPSVTFKSGSLLAKRNSGGEQYVNYFTIAGQG